MPSSKFTLNETLLPLENIANKDFVSTLSTLRFLKPNNLEGSSEIGCTLLAMERPMIVIANGRRN